MLGLRVGAVNQGHKGWECDRGGERGDRRRAGATGAGGEVHGGSPVVRGQARALGDDGAGANFWTQQSGASVCDDWKQSLGATRLFFIV